MRPIKLDLTAHERLALERLAVQDRRLPSQQLVWLLMEEAKRRGLADKEAAQKPETTKHNRAAEVVQTQHSAVVAATIN